MIDQLCALVGASNVLSHEADQAGYLTDWRRRFTGRALAVVRPGSTEEVAAVVRLCAQTQTPIVTQGGNTGLVGGATPDASGRAIVLSLARMNRIRAIDTANNTVTVEAGCVLQTLQQAARDAGRLFPLSLAAEGSCTIGGNLSTNAGGIQVLRYGNTRELCLGLEVVTPQGEVWNGLVGLRKDNTGYDLRDLYIGAEGTLGVITAACMKLYPMPKARATALAALRSIADAVALLELAQAHCGPTLTGFEMLTDVCLRLVEKHFPAHKSPFADAHPVYVLLEISDHEDEAHATALFESLMERAFEANLVVDAVVAQSVAQSQALWALRENISEAQAHEGKNIKHDISVPISRIAEFCARTGALIEQRYPGVQLVNFGHLGDGNLHYNVSPPPGQPEAEFLAQQPGIYELVHDQVAAFGGSISAEHGIGQLKRQENERYKSPVAIRLMRTIKHALDPLGIMNPGKLV
ncbi:MAG TPA: FAD-binding oxidoreductase [Burkholderiaceae bacterium]|nr:FAD-binding oxidoreductase [Burkholderiaceae bacterium]